MKSELEASNLIKWPLLNKLSEETRRQVKWFSYQDDRFYCVLEDNRVLTAGDNKWGLLGLGHEDVVHDVEEIIELKDKEVVKIVPGWDFVAALTATKRVYAWGGNGFGQLGTSSKGDNFKPVLVEIPEDIVDIKCGMWHSIALDVLGQAWTWGENRIGQLGNGTNRDNNKPAVVTFLKHLTITEIECGDWHSLAVSSEGKVYGWGYLGRYENAHMTISSTRLPLKLDICSEKITSVVASRAHSLFLTESGLLYNFGFRQPKPELIDCGQVRFTHIYKVDYQIFSRFTVNCHLFVALSNLGVCYVWGNTKTGTLESPTRTELSLTEAFLEHSSIVAPPFMMLSTLFCEAVEEDQKN